MNEQEYNKWVEDAKISLALKYNPSEVETVMEWFHYIRGSAERALVGDKAVDDLTGLFYKQPFPFDLHTSLMMRLWYYAPYILQSENPDRVMYDRSKR